MKTPKAEKLPSGSWRCRVRINGSYVSVTRETKAEAERAALLLKLDPAVSRNKVTLREAINKYVDARSNVLSPSTILNYKYIRDWRFQEVMDCELSRQINWQAVINHEAEEVSAKTIKNAFGLVRSVLAEYGLSPGRVQLPQIQKKERAFLTPEQIKQFVAAIKDDRYELAYLLCLHGLRRSEMLALRKDQVKNGTIHVSGAMVRGEDGMVFKKENKTVDSRRDVPILTDRVTLLVSQSHDGLLCPWPPRGMEKHLSTILKRAELPHGGFHMLRHSYASLGYYLNIPTITIMRTGGWSDISTLQKIYTHLAEEEDLKAAKKMRKYFRA